MSDTITTHFAVEGEAEYKKAISEINAGLKVNYAQMGLVAARYDEAGESEDALKAKSIALTETIKAQAAKVSVLSGQVQKSIEKTGENSAETNHYKAQLVSAETELTKMQNQLGKYDAAMQSSTKETSSMGDVLNDLLNTMGVSVPPAMQGMINKLDGVSASGAAAATVVVGLTVALGKMTEDEAKAADNLLTLSSQTGLTTDQLQEFEYASELVDVSTDTLQGSLRKLTKNMDAARSGSGDAADAFKQLGVRVTDAHGNLRSADDVFMDCIDKLGKVKNGTEADAMSMAIFGKSAQDLNPLIDAGSDKLRSLADEAHNVGYVLDNDTLQSFGELDDANQRWEKKIDAVKEKLAEGLLPVLTGITDALNAIPTPVLTGIAVAGGVLTVMVLITKAVKDAAIAMQALGIANTIAGTTAVTAGAGLSTMLPALLIIGAIALGAGAIAGIVTAAKSNATQAANAATAAQRQRHNARGTQFFEGGGTWVGEDGPEYVDLPRGSRIHPNEQSVQRVGGKYTDSTTNVFKVDDIETYQKIEQRMRMERQSRRMGYVKKGAMA